MDLDPVLLSRLQFVWVIAWHILLPAFTVGLASYIAFAEGMHFFTGRDIYLRISTFWTKIFSVYFGMGVVSGIVMPFQFGTNWSRYADATANVLSPLFAYEGLIARPSSQASCVLGGSRSPGDTGTSPASLVIAILRSRISRALARNTSGPAR